MPSLVAEVALPYLGLDVEASNQHDETLDNFAAMAAEVANSANATKSMWADKYRGVSSIFFFFARSGN